MIPYPSEIKEDNGKIYRRCTVEHYTVNVEGKFSEIKETATYLYLYEKDNSFFWRIERCEKETDNTFFPQSITIEVYSLQKNDKDELTYYGTDIKTGERYFIVNLSSEDGYIYMVGDEVNQIVYSIPYSNIKYR